jgi:hypothetical protein
MTVCASVPSTRLQGVRASRDYVHLHKTGLAWIRSPEIPMRRETMLSSNDDATGPSLADAPLRERNPNTASVDTRALGADEIVMHPFAELGPIDPTVANDFNPVEQGTGRRLGISVEDVTAYVDFIKKTVGITHEDELVRAIEILANKVHPLALGNVERFLAQSRMIARKILRSHAQPPDDHTIDEIVENMASKLYFHGHPINRREAREDLGLKVAVDLTPELETALWDLYKDYEAEFDNQTIFYPPGDLAALPAPGTTPPEKEYELLYAVVESARLASKYTIQRRCTLIPLAQPGQQAIQDQILKQGWSHSSAPSTG